MRIDVWVTLFECKCKPKQANENKKRRARWGLDSQKLKIENDKISVCTIPLHFISRFPFEKQLFGNIRSFNVEIILYLENNHFRRRITVTSISHTRTLHNLLWGGGKKIFCHKKKKEKIIRTGTNESKFCTFSLNCDGASFSSEGA